MIRIKLTLFWILILVVFQVIHFKTASCSPVKSDKELSEERINILKNLAKKLNSSINFSVDPCVDYYNYVCGNFKESDRLVKLYPDTDYVKEVFEKHIKYEDNDLDETNVKAKQFFESCQNQDQFDLEDFLKKFNFPNSIGGWPAFTSDWSAENFDFTTAVAELNSYGVQVVVDLRISTRENHTYLSIVPESIPSSNELGFYQAALFPRDNTTLLKIGVNNASDVLNDYFFVEKKYLKVIEKHNDSKAVKDFKTLKEWTPNFSWEKYLEIVTGLTFGDEDKFIIINGETMEQLILTLTNVDKKVLANFFFYKFLDLKTSNIIAYGGVSCYEQTFNVFPHVFARAIVNNYSNKENMVQITDTLLYLIDSSDDFKELYDEKSKDEIKDDIKDFIFNDYLLKIRDEKINEEFRDLKITPDGYYENVLNIINRNVKEIFDNTFSNRTKPNKMRLFLGESLSQAIYYGYNKPVSVLLNELDLLLLAASAVRIKLLSAHQFPEASVECFKRQLQIEVVDKVDLWQNELLQKVVKAFSLWVQDNSEINETENEILKDFGLSNIRLLLIGSIQETCRYDYSPTEDEIRTHQAAWGNLKEFADEYNCPEGSPMNPSAKCSFL